MLLTCWITIDWTGGWLSKVSRLTRGEVARILPGPVALGKVEKQHYFLSCVGGWHRTVVEYPLSQARWLVPKMVKNGLKSSFVFSRLIWASLVSNS